MFLRKLTVLLVPLCMLLALCLLTPLLYSMSPYIGSLIQGSLLGVLLSLLLPLSGATRLREPFAWLLWIPSAVIVLVLLYQFLASQQIGRDWPVLRLLATSDSRLITIEASFASYMLTFSVRTGKGI